MASSAAILLRPATLADAALLRRWDEQPHVIASDPSDDWQWEIELGRFPDWREQLIAEASGRPVGIVQIIDPHREESQYWGDVPANLRAIDIWIGEAADLGKGYGTKMMALALTRCFAVPTVAAVLIDPLASNTRAHRFYQRLGFRPVGRRSFGMDDCLVHRLDRADHFRIERRQAVHVSAIRLFVRDLAPAKAFYAGVLGLQLTHENAEHGYLTFDIDGIDLVVETVGTDAPPDEQALVGRFTGVSFAVKDIGIEYARMAAMGVAFPGLPEKQAWGGWLATFRDPSGNELQLAQYPD